MLDRGEVGMFVATLFLHGHGQEMVSPQLVHPIAKRAGIVFGVIGVKFQKSLPLTAST